MPTAYTQVSFSGGMNLFDEIPTIAEDQYGLAFNIRNRSQAPIPIKQAVEDTELPAGLKQGIYAFDVYVLAFVGGAAYFKNIEEATAWTPIANFALSPTVERIYAQAVPASRINYDRKLKEASQAAGNNAESSLNVIPDLSIQGSPYGLVVQDGVNQGYIILPDGTARLLQRYNEWTRSSREYVPVLKQMAYVDGILFGVAAYDKDGNADGKTIYRSVSGRPLDFVVSVTTAGEKGGEAFETAHAVGFDEITALIPFTESSLLVATKNAVTPVLLDFENTIFGEPKFKNPVTIPVGVTNQFSIVSYLSLDRILDFFFVDIDGLRSLNSTEQGNEGRNSFFSKGIKLALSPKQEVTAAIVFDDYSLFSIKTIYNEENLVAVFDNLRERWVCFDSYNIGTIKQFAVAKQGTAPTLYAITDDKIYRLFVSETSETATMQFRAISSGDASVQLNLTDIRSVFINSNSTGIVFASAYIDGSILPTVVRERLRGLSKVENIRSTFKDSNPLGYTISPQIAWNTQCNLLLIQVDATGDTKKTNVKQQANINA